MFRSAVRYLIGMAAAVLPAAAALAQTPVPSAAPAPRFEIGAYRTTGNTLIDTPAIESLVAPHTGKDKEFADIQNALTAIRAAYAGKGYRGVSVALPEQELDGGIVRIVVTETAIEKVAVSGNGHFDAERIRAFFPMLEEGRPVDFDRLGRALDVVNENPALKTAIEIAPGSREGTRVARIAAADEDPITLFATLDNSGTAATGKDRLTVGLRHADVAGLGHVLTAQYSASVEKSAAVSFWGVGYRVPLPAHGLAVDLYAGHSDVNSGVVADLFNVAGKGTIGGIKATWQLDRRGGYRHQAWAGLDYRAFDNNVVPVGGNQSLVPDYTVHPLSLGYAASYGTATGSATLLRGFRGGANSDSATLAQARAGADADYTALRFSGSYAHALAAGWAAHLGLSGQHTRDALVPGEQLGLGGAQSVRGFDERFIAGDSGYRAMLEFHTPQAVFGDLRLKGIGFADWGALRRNQVQPGELAAESLASWGLGMRVALARQVSLSLDAARVLRGTLAHPTGSGRIHLSLTATF